MTTPSRLLPFLVLCFAVSAALRAEAARGFIAGLVVGVHDGDTITVLDAGKKQHKVRLFGIDAPELKQAHEAKAKKQLSDLVFKKQIRVEVTGSDRYRRVVGRVFVGETDAGLEMVRVGLAWHYVRYAKGDTLLAEAEREAKAAKRGLWADPSPVPPWAWRNGRR